MSTAAPPPSPAATGTQAEFARAQGWSRGYVSKLKGEGRLVFATDGVLDFAATLARIKATTGVDSRAAPAVMGAAFGDAKDRNEHYTAELTRLKFEREIGAVWSAEDVRQQLARVLAELCAGLDQLPDRLAPLLAALAGDEQRIRAELRDTIHHLRADLAAGMATVGQDEPPATA